MTTRSSWVRASSLMLNHSRRIVSRRDWISRINVSASVIVWSPRRLACHACRSVLQANWLSSPLMATFPSLLARGLPRRNLFIVHPLALRLARRQLSSPLWSGAQAASSGRGRGSDARRTLRGQGVRRYHQSFCKLRSAPDQMRVRSSSCSHPWQVRLPSAVMWCVDTADPSRLCSFAIKSRGTDSSPQFGAPGTLIRRWLRRVRAQDRFFKEFWNKTPVHLLALCRVMGRKNTRWKIYGQIYGEAQRVSFRRCLLPPRSRSASSWSLSLPRLRWSRCPVSFRR